MMKTISIQEQVGTLPHPRALLPAPTQWALRPHKAVRDWLPVPAIPAKTTKAAPPASSVWISLPEEPIMEKVLFWILAAAAVIAIGYGFSKIVDLVHNWASINATIAHLIQ